MNSILRDPERYRRLTESERLAVWPSTKELGGYSYPLGRSLGRGRGGGGGGDKAALQTLWTLLLDTLTVDTCPNAGEGG